MTMAELVARYDTPVPRYTSYPPVPHWCDTPTEGAWTTSLRGSLADDDASLALYVHVPFCESLCTFCGCNTVITRDHRHESSYVDLVLAELDAYLARVPELAARPFRQCHLGGGTPTFLAVDALDRLLGGIAARLGSRADDFEGSIEVDPRVTTRPQLEVLRRHGFSRVSLGVQDVDEGVQKLVNRIQPIERTVAVCDD
ncbi:MAG TPA: radical SAM protein, partial [Vicinamibacterales bacterium]|nr:radical SAM protein [Vicinamibacterales bacterium]